MNGPLQGIKVVDCSVWIQGPMAGAILGDLGADVIKVEKRGKGDAMRGYVSPFKDVARQVDFEVPNRNKRGIVLDLTKQEGREVIYELVKRSDVFVHNFRSKAAASLGLGYETLSRLNPRLVYAQASGWGLKGPISDQGAFDVAAAARTGLMYAVGETEDSPPGRTPNAIIDCGGALCLTIGILAALQAREQLGRGQMIDSSLFGAAITLGTWPISFGVMLGRHIARRPRTVAPNPLYNCYKCANGEWVQLVMMQFDRYWPAFCEAMGIKELQNDSRFENIGAMHDHSAELISVLDEIFPTKTRAEWMKIFTEQDFHFAPIQRAVELANDPQALANDYITEFDHPIHGREKVVGFPYSFSETPASLRLPCPEYGQHTEEVLLELGYTWDDITRFKETEII